MKTKKNKVGRPKIKNPKFRKNICLTKETYEFYLKLGNGNFSKAIELAKELIQK